MIIKSVIRGGYRSAAAYMQDQGKNEQTRLVELSDPSAKNLDDAFHNMWVVASNTRCTKPLHHISINPMKGERLTDTQLMKIVEHCEKIYDYQMFHHQRVIVEHIKDGRQHFHVIWNRVSLVTGRPVWPGMHWNKSKQICREMEKELGLKSPTPRVTGRKPYSPKSSVRHSISRGQSDQARSTMLLYRPVVSKMLYKVSSETASKMFVPDRPKTGWPPAALLDWKVWGHRNPRRFFNLWPELAR